jgi:K+-sensing histidine kinase KdpD
MRRHGHHERRSRNLEPHGVAAPADLSLEPPELAIGTAEIPKFRDLDEDNELVEIVHDFKNPLATMALEMCLLEEQLRYVASGDMRATLTRITRNIAFIDRLVSNILDTNAIDAGSFSLRRRRTELSALLGEVVERSVATRDRARVHIEAPEAVHVVLDSDRIERVVANLVHNALKYASTGTPVVLRLERFANHARVLVIDCGPGISRHDLDWVFERYHRADHRGSADGCGLGLYISRRIVEAHGGTIGVESVPDIGSQFYFDLPLR